MKKQDTKLHALENDILVDVISTSDTYNDDSYLDNEDFRNAYKDFNFIRKMRFLLEYISENDECKHDFDDISNDSIEQFIQKLQNYRIGNDYKQQCIRELNYIINNRK